MLKKALTAFILPFLFLLNPPDAGCASPIAQQQKSGITRTTPQGFFKK
jgi:hypothetical protein